MSGILYKKIAFLAPRADLTREAFLDYWERVHGPTVAAAPDYGRWRHRYVQNHVVVPGPFGVPPAFAGMAMFWLPGPNEDDYGQSSTYRDHVRPDELNFIDMDATTSVTATEEVVMPGTGDVKLVVLVPAHSSGAALAPSAAPSANARDDGEVVGYRLNRVVPGSLRLPGARRATGPEVAEVHEIWFETVSAAMKAAGWKAFPDDAVCFVAREHVFFDAD